MNWGKNKLIITVICIAIGDKLYQILCPKPKEYMEK